MERIDVRERPWTIFSNHGTVLVHLAAYPNSTLRTISDALGITERQVARIVKDLQEAKMLHVQKQGRRNIYAVNSEAYLRHPTLAHIPLERVIAAIVPMLVDELSEDRSDLPPSDST